MKGIAKFIVKSRAFILVLFLLLAVLSVVTGPKVHIVNDIYEYLPADTETKRGLDVMDGFTTYSTARIMLRDITFEEAEEIADEIEDIENIRVVKFTDDLKHYKAHTALIEVTFSGGDNDEVSTDSLAEIRELLIGREGVSVSTSVGYDMTKNIVKEMSSVGVMSVAVVIFLLLLTSRSYAEVPPLLISYGMAALLQWGSNFFLGEISFIANSVTLVLQLALAIDYSVILCNRFAEEREKAEPKKAMVQALSKAIPEVFASSLTTIGGLAAMTFMQFRLGYDVGIVLIKAIFISLATVFSFLPCLLLLFARAIEKTKHRSFVPKVDRLGKFAYKTRKIIPPIFLLVLVLAFVGTSNIDLSYNYSETMPLIPDESYQATKDIREVFGYENMMAVIVPAGDYEKEADMLDEMMLIPTVDSVTGISTAEVMGEHRLFDKVSMEEFAEIAGLDDISSRYLFTYYTVHSGDFESAGGNIKNVKISIMDLFNFLYESAESGKIELDDEKLELVEDLHAQLADAEEQLQTEKYDRMLVYADVSVESEEARKLVGTLHEIAQDYYGEDVYVVGEASSARDLNATFQKDNLLISGLSALFVIIVIIISFRSFGLAVLLIAVIQGSIWINFSVPVLPEGKLYFLAYLIVMAMQMGANIDYAIVVSNRYLECRENHMKKRSAIIIAMNKGISTIVTSGSILAVAGFLIAVYSTTPAASHIGLALGRGTVISLILVLFVLPQILVWGDKFIMLTTSKKSAESVFRVPSLFGSDFEELARIEAGMDEPKPEKKPVKAEAKPTSKAAKTKADAAKKAPPIKSGSAKPKSAVPKPKSSASKNDAPKPKTAKPKAEPKKKKRSGLFDDDFEELARKQKK